MGKILIRRINNYHAKLSETVVKFMTWDAFRGHYTSNLTLVCKMILRPL